MSTIKTRIDQDLKLALLARDRNLATTLRGLKSSILYEEVASKQREEGLDNQSVVAVLKREAKKRQDSADLYEQGGDNDRRDKELDEKKVITNYLPEEMSEETIKRLVDEVVASDGPLTPQTMGVIIGKVKGASQGLADGATIARLVKERLGA